LAPSVARKFGEKKRPHSSPAIINGGLDEKKKVKGGKGQNTFREKSWNSLE